MSKFKKWMTALVLLVLITSQLPRIQWVQAASEGNLQKITETRKIRILEIQPTNSFQLNNIPNAEIVRMPMTQFIGTVDEVNGKYDLIYIGNYNGTYSHFGRKQNKNTGTALSDMNNNYYSGNDMTQLKANKIAEYIESGQLVVYDRAITNTYSTSIVYKLLDQYKNRNNVIAVNSFQANQLATYLSNANIRPFLQLTKKPKTYVELNPASYETEQLNFIFNAYTKDDSKMQVNLYLDVDGDGIYDDAERFLTLENPIEDGEGYVINFTMPENYTGVIPWKLELVNVDTGAKDYAIGYSAFKGTKRNIRVLQIYPNGNTFSIKNGLMNLLDACSDEYNFIIEEEHVTNFQNRYQTNPSYTLNGKYDMIILGFADMYGSNDITNTRALNDIENFIKTGQSVMFTHDTFTFNQTGWAAKLTERFRTIAGQNRFANDYLPPGSSFSYGFSDMAISRAETGAFDTTTTTIKLNEGLLTQYPYQLGDIQVQSTHYQYYQLDLEDEEVVPWFTLHKNNSLINSLDPRNYYYTYSKGNITYSGTGHANLSQSGYIDERKLFVNTIVKAARGANYAPMIKVDRVINRNDKLIIEIPTGYSNAEFDFTAIDLDKGDELLNGRIYVDKNQDGNFSTSEIIKQYTVGSSVNPPIISTKKETVRIENIDDNWFKKGNVVKIKVEVFDSKNALSYKEIELHQVDKPVFTMNSTPQGSLVGDTVDLATFVNLIITDRVNEKGINTISLKRTILKDGTPVNINEKFQLLEYNQWNWINNYELRTKTSVFPNVVINNMGPSWNNQKIDLKFKPKEVGVYEIVNDFTYRLQQANTNEAMTNVHTFEVKEGRINVQVMDEASRSVENLTVTVTDKTTNTVVFSQNTDVNGIVRARPLPTGTYEVKVNGISATEIVDLSYEQPIKDLSFVYNSVYFDNVNLKVKDRNGADTNTKYIRDNSAFEATLSVEIKQKLTDLMIEINCTDPSDATRVNFDYEVIGSSTDKFEVVVIGGKKYIKNTAGTTVDTGNLSIQLRLRPIENPQHGLIYTLKANKFLVKPIGGTSLIERTNDTGALEVVTDKVAPVITAQVSPLNRMLASNSELTIKINAHDNNTKLVAVYWEGNTAINYVEVGDETIAKVSNQGKTVEFVPPTPAKSGYYKVYAEDIAGNVVEYIIFINNLGLPELI